MSEESSQTELLAARLAGVTEAQAREINEFLDNREAKAISVGELLERGYEYFIPNYQRGYRWTQLEVETLLHDIEEASAEKKHCLQPLVLKKLKENKYTVIDGQQRLTTISIILAWCNQKEKTTCKRPSIKYETRTGSLSFLENIKDKTKDDADANVDFWNMYQAYVCCEEYAKGKENIVSIIKENLLNHCSFILYIAGKGENEHEIFKRLNSGKIALTNAELTKALLLHDRPDKEQLEMALKWDEMMHFFENDDFWYFICPEPESEKYQQTRLDFLIELVAGTESGTGGDRYASFRALDTTIREGGSISAKWKELIRFYHIMRYWYEDTPKSSSSSEIRSLYHLIGFVLKRGDEKPKGVLQNFVNLKKSEFRNWCLERIRDKLKINNETELRTKIKNLNYDDKSTYKDITNLLLLMNIATLEFNAGENSRYPFAAHVREKWSLEHIHATNEEITIDSLKEYLPLIGSENFTQREIGSLNSDEIKDIHNACLDKFAKSYGSDNFKYETSFGNLALLPKNFNSKLNNAPYNKKREFILDNCTSKSETIIPICTRYAFFKFYSPMDQNNVIWKGENARHYTDAAIKLISHYLNLK